MSSFAKRGKNTLAGLNRDVSAGTSHSEPDGSATKPAISRSEDGASQGAVPIPREPTEEMWRAAALAISELYRGDGGWCGLEAAREQARITWNAMINAAPQASARGRETPAKPDALAMPAVAAPKGKP